MIRLDNVTKTYRGNVVALRDISLDIAKGEFVFLVGSSGSGKSTFIKLLIKDESPDRGDIWVAGKRLNELKPWKVPTLRRELGCVFQDFKLLENKTVRENVAFALEVIGKPRQVINRTVPEVLELVGLAHKLEAKPTELSGGEQQRVSIARAFVNRPRILLCDEPTGNLDSKNSLAIGELLRAVAGQSDATLVIVTHSAALAETFARRLRMSDGMLLDA